MAVTISGWSQWNLEGQEAAKGVAAKGVTPKTECIGKSGKVTQNGAKRHSPIRSDPLFTPQNFMGAKKIKFPSCCQAHPNNFGDSQEWDRGSHPFPSCPSSGSKPCRALGFRWKCPPVLAQGIGCSRIIPESKTRHIPDCQWRGSEQTLENGQDLLSAWLESAGWTHSVDGSFSGLLPTHPAHPSHGCSLFFFSLEIAPGSAALHGLAAFRGPGQRQQLPLVGFLWLFVLESSQNFQRKCGFLFLCLPLPQFRIFIRAPDMEILRKSANFHQIPPRRRVGFL